MKHLLLLLVAPSLVLAQVPRIGLIDFYGARHVTTAQLRSVIDVSEGDPLPPSKADVEDRLENVSGVVRARLEAVCCEADKAILYVGIEEKGAPHFDYRVPPSSAVALPDDLLVTYRQFLTAVGAAVREGENWESFAHGHSLMKDPACRALQLKLEQFAKDNVSLLRDVLRNCSNDEQRAVAAYVIGYAERKRFIVDDLQYALRDPSDAVRYNAMRSLTAIAVLASKSPELNVKVSPTWFVEMLNSLIWGDRNKAALALVTLADGRDANTLQQIRENGLDSVLEMAQWRHLEHALPAFILAGRLAGLSEDEIHKAWDSGDRATVIRKVRKTAPKKR